jgi:hypothetical protein
VKPKQFITKFIAFICLLALSQKMGGGLYLHNLFHNKDFKTTGGNTTVQYSCNCIDDFTMPFTEADVVELPPIPITHFNHNSFYKEPISFQIRFFNSLRAPPIA